MSIATLDRPTSETIAVSFADLRLRPSTLQALAGMGITEPTPIQAAALPPLMDGQDVIGQARTGSGKTLAFAIPAAELVEPERRAVQVLVLTPTRELATQVGSVIEQVASPRGITVGLIFGGRALGPQRDMLRRGVHIVVGTPGRVLDLLNQGALWLDHVRFLVLDEADEMLDLGFAPDVERILSRTSSSRQTALFSATVPDWVRQTSSKHLHDAITVAVDPRPEDSAPIEHVAYDIPDGDKLSALRDLLNHRGEGSMIVFGRTKHGVKKLARQLERDGYPVAALQGNLSQNARDKVMEDFRSGQLPILVATNVAARGIDVTSIEQVINVDLPESPDLLTHRIGRTGRMGRPGQAITLLAPEDGAKWRQLERGLGRRVPRVQWRGAKAALAGPPAEAVLAPIRTERAPSMPRQSHAPAPVRARPRVEERIERSAPRRAPVLIIADDASSDDRHNVAPREIATYGRDPQRPSWVSNGGSDTQGPRPRPSAVGQSAESDRPERVRHQIVCDGCGQTAEVPFRPTPGRPVYCNACFRSRDRRNVAATV